MLNFTHDIPTKIFFGKGSISHLDEALKPFGKNVLLAYGGGSIKRSGLYDTVMEILNNVDITLLNAVVLNQTLELLL